MRSGILSILVFVGIPCVMEAQLTFQKTYGGAATEINDCLNKTTGALCTVPGSGYAVCHTTHSFGTPLITSDASVYFLRLDINGDTIATKAYSGPSNHSFGRSVFPAADGGFIIGAEMGGGYHSLCLLRTNNFGDTLWTRRFEGSSGMSIGYFGFPLSDGGFAGCGMFQTNKCGGHIVKTNAAGNLVFGKTYLPVGQGHGMYFYSAVESYDHGILATGLYMPTAMTSSILVMKTDSAGNPLWTKSYDGPDYQAGYNIRELPNHNIIVTGYSDGTNGLGDDDAVLLMTDPNGNVLFEKLYGDQDYQWTNALTVLPNGNIVLCGSHKDSTGQGPTLASLVCIDTTGAIQWSRTYGFSYEIANSVATADDGGIVFTGYSGAFGAGSGDIYFVKTDANGMTGCYNAPIPYSSMNVAVTTTVRSVTVLNNITAVATNCTVDAGGIVTPLCSNVGINETPHDQFEMYPNPADGHCFIAGTTNETVNIVVYNAAGQEVVRREKVKLFAGQPYELALDNLPGGMYLVTVSNEAVFSQKQLIIPSGRK